MTVSDLPQLVRIPMRNIFAAYVIGSFALGTCVYAEAQAADELQPNPAQQALESIRAANVARAATAAEKENWRLERDRLQSLLDASATDAQRLRQDLTDAEHTRQEADAEATRLGSDTTLARARQILTETAAFVHRRLAELAAALPPGAVVVPSSTADDLDESIHALTLSERTAATVSIEVVSGQVDGRDAAVKLLRVSGAAAWWLSMDGRDAGSVAVVNGHLVLTPIADEREVDEIRRAITITEGRQPSGIVMLPMSVSTVSGSHP